MAEERLIRKYANRRLYDATGSRHVTLDDIRKMIGAGERVKVIEDKSGEDITRAMLLQIIANQDQFGTPVLSTQLLEALIRFYGNPVQEMLSKYLEQSIGSLLQQQQVMHRIWSCGRRCRLPCSPRSRLKRRRRALRKRSRRPARAANGAAEFRWSVATPVRGAIEFDFQLTTTRSVGRGRSRENCACDGRWTRYRPCACRVLRRQGRESGSVGYQ